MPPRSSPPAKAASAAERLPAWYPAWARELADLYFSGTTCLFILHGNVHDLVHCPTAAKTPIAAWPSFSPRRSSARWDLVLGYDLSQGLRPQAGRDAERLRAMQQYLTVPLGRPGRTGRAIPIRRCSCWTPLSSGTWWTTRRPRKSVALLFEYAQYLLPAGDLDSLVRGQGAGWSASCARRRTRSSSR